MKYLFLRCKESLLKILKFRYILFFQNLLQYSKYKAIKKERKDKMKKIRALQNYTDSVLKKNIVIGEEYIVDNERAEVITNNMFKDKPLAEIIEDIKEEEKESNKEVKPETTTKKKATKK